MLRTSPSRVVQHSWDQHEAKLSCLHCASYTMHLVSVALAVSCIAFLGKMFPTIAIVVSLSSMAYYFSCLVDTNFYLLLIAVLGIELMYFHAGAHGLCYIALRANSHDTTAGIELRVGSYYSAGGIRQGMSKDFSVTSGDRMYCAPTVCPQSLSI